VTSAPDHVTAALTGLFVPPQSPVVFVESTAGELYLERRNDIARHEESLRHQVAGALDPDSSVRLIKEVEKTFGP
jgi:hypothetical protein